MGQKLVNPPKENRRMIMEFLILPSMKFFFPKGLRFKGFHPDDMVLHPCKTIEL